MHQETLLTTTSADCRVLAFARSALAGEIVVGPDVRNACKRHLSDLELGQLRGLVWDQAAADRAIGFFEDVLCLNGGDYEGARFLLAPWQAFVVGSLFGWYVDDGVRRYRLAYIETGKGSGKSPLIAGIGLYGLVADGEQRAEIYAAATKKDQAMIMFRDAVSMVTMSPKLAARIEQSGRNEKIWNLFYPNTNSFFRAISNDDGQSGPRPHMGLLDEVHEHKTASAVEMMRAGTKNRRRALVAMITNSGSDKNSVAGQYHEKGVAVCRGDLIDDTFFAFICSLDEGDDPLTDEACWPKVNPSLDFIPEGRTDGIPGRRYLREQVVAVRGLPAKEAVVKRLNFCVWTAAENPWISGDVWLGAAERVPMRMLRNRPCVAGLDLASTTDLTSFVLLFYPAEADPHWRLLPYFWIPDHDLEGRETRDRVPYRVWIAEGHLETTPGRAISKLHVLRRLQKICGYFDVHQIGYDRWRIEDLKELMLEHDIVLPEMVPFGQGYQSMSPAVDEFERRLLGSMPPVRLFDGSEVDTSRVDLSDCEDLDGEGRVIGRDLSGMVLLNDCGDELDVHPGYYHVTETLRHDGNPVLTMCAANAVTTSDPANNRKVDKAKSNGRIDGIVASVIATGISGSAPPGGGTSIYDKGVGI